MDLVAGVDFETTGIDSEKDFITEIGAALFDARTWEPQAYFTTFVKIPIAVPPEITKLTGITNEMLSDGKEPAVAIKELHKFLLQAKAVVAHNAPFDQGFFYHAAGASGLEIYDIQTYGSKWYCSNSDVPHVDKYCRKLSHLALDYGVKVDITRLHRALDDVKLMGQMLKGTGFTFDQIKAFADEPWVYLKAVVRYEQRELAKKAGYGWEKCHGTYTPIFKSTWVKRVKESKLEAEKSEDCGFKREVISPAS